MLDLGVKVTGQVAGQFFTGVIETRYVNGETVEYTVATDQELIMPSGRKVRKALTSNVQLAN